MAGPAPATGVFGVSLLTAVLGLLTLVEHLRWASGKMTYTPQPFKDLRAVFVA